MWSINSTTLKNSLLKIGRKQTTSWNCFTTSLKTERFQSFAKITSESSEGHCKDLSCISRLLRMKDSRFHWNQLALKHYVNSTNFYAKNAFIVQNRNTKSFMILFQKKGNSKPEDKTPLTTSLRSSGHSTSGQIIMV